MGFLSGFNEPTTKVTSFYSLPKFPDSWKG